MRMRITAGIFYSKLARRIFLLFIICALLPIITLTALTFSQVTARLEHQYEKSLQHMAKSVGMTIYERLLLFDSNLKIIASDFDRGRPLFNFAHESQQKHFEQWFEGIVHVAADGERQSVFKDIKGLPQVDPDDFADKTYERTIILAKIDDRKARVFLIKYLDDNSTARGYLAAEVNSSFLWGIGHINTIPQQTRLCVIDQYKNVLITPFGGSKKFMREMERRKLVNTVNRHFEFESDGKVFLASYWSIFMRSSFIAPNWIIILSRDKADVLKPLNHFKIIFPLVVLLAIWVVLLISSFYIRKSLVPLEKLKKGAERIGEGDFSGRIEVTSRDEFAELADSFNTMSAQLSRQFQALQTMGAIDRAILSSLDTAKVVDTVLNGTYNLLDCDMVGIALIDEEQRRLTHFIKAGKVEQVAVENGGPIDEQRLEDMTGKELFSFRKEDLPACVDVLHKYDAVYFIVLPLYVREQIAGMLILGFDEEEKAERREDLVHARQLANQMAVALSNAHLLEDLDEMGWGAIKALGRTVDAKSSWTAGHSERVTTYAMHIARAMELPQDRQKVLHRAALLHDIGKIGIPLKVLDKPERLTDAEYELIKQHPAMGARILEPIGAFRESIPIIMQHHEQYNGQGYPEGLSGENILIEARILTVADVFDALISERPYRKEWDREKIVGYLAEKAGTFFDPKVVGMFLDLLERDEVMINPLVLFE